MNLDFASKDLAFRDEVRDFLASSLTEELKRASRLMTSVYADIGVMRAWHRVLFERGWVAPSWPVEYGGCNWTVVQRYIFASEMARAGAPPLSPMGTKMCGPALIGFGTPAQKAFYLPRILSGEDFWCQGYSEPDAGSDLASLKMSAVDDGDHFICNGQKIWTTHAQHANRVFCLVRTSRHGAPRKGITFLLIDMNTPGIRVQPIVMLTGEHIQNQIFFENVRVPKANVLGKIDDGWTVAKYLLEFERGGSVFAPGLRAHLAKVRLIARSEETGAGDRLLDDPTFAAKLAQTEIDIAAFEYIELRAMAAASQNQSPGNFSSALKLNGTELSQRLTELAIEAVSYYALPYQPHATSAGGDTLTFGPASSNEFPIGPDYSWPVAAKYFNDRAGTIYAGSSEVQRNILAKQVLRL